MSLFKNIQILALIGFLLFLVSNGLAVNGENELVIVSDNGFLDNYGNYIIVGELKNNWNKPINYVQINATYYGLNNEIIAVRSGATMIFTILPNRSSPFKINLIDPIRSSKVKYYNLTVKFEEAPLIPRKIALVNDTSEFDSDGNLIIRAIIKNLGEEKLRNAKVIVSFYDNFGKIIYAKLVNLDPEIYGEIYPNKSISFDILLEKDIAKDVNDYKITAESEQYTFLMSNEFTISMEIVGNGKVIKEPDNYFYNLGSIVKITAIPNEGWVFLKWEGDLTSSDNPLNISLNKDISIRAIFVEDKNEFNISIILLLLFMIIFIAIIILYHMLKKH